MPHLKIFLHDTHGVTHDLTNSEITVGRTSDNSLQIEDASISSAHATLTLDSSGDYVLRDIGSTNGTILNGKPLIPGTDHRLQNGDKVRFGNIVVSYLSENPAEARPLPEAEETTAVVAATSKRPADFANASPFRAKRKKNDPVSVLLFVFAALAIAAWGYVIWLIYSLKPPPF